ncbi:hypothetical protein [Novosphingobium sp.]|uniref:hypothetical protein n=1 Tax=Novosphingobium sp. TaxID=1874826 RepID=UPI003BA8FC99
MTRTQIHSVSGIGPLVLSGVALALLTIVLGTGWERNLNDEGTAAHLFQICVALQIPLIAVFALTSTSGEKAATARMLALQCAALVFCLAMVFVSGL